MSDYPATLGDLADVEARLEDQIKRIADRWARDDDVLLVEMSHLNERIAQASAGSELAARTNVMLEARVRELEKLWEVAMENPDLVRELALQALKGREGQ